MKQDVRLTHNWQLETIYSLHFSGAGRSYWTNLCSLHRRHLTCIHPRLPRSRHGSARTFDRPALLDLPAPVVCHPGSKEHRHSSLRLHLSANTTPLWSSGQRTPISAYSCWKWIHITQQSLFNCYTQHRKIPQKRPAIVGLNSWVVKLKAI